MISATKLCTTTDHQGCGNSVTIALWNLQAQVGKIRARVEDLTVREEDLVYFSYYVPGPLVDGAGAVTGTSIAYPTT